MNQQAIDYYAQIPDSMPMPEHVWHLEHILEWLDDPESGVTALMKKKYRQDDADEMAERMLDLLSHLATSTEVMASTRWYRDAAHVYHYDRVVNVVKSRIVQGTLPKEVQNTVASPVNLKKYLEAKCAYYNSIHTRVERLNAAITNTISALQSALGKARVDKQTSHFAGGQIQKGGY